MRLPNTDRILFGGDYNPEQWPEETWAEDMRLFHEAHVNELTLNVFSWALLQPAEDTWDFRKLDKIMALAKENNMRVFLATATAAHPAWMSMKYPETNRVDAWGRRHKHGGRQNICPTSPVIRKYTKMLAGKLSQRYGACDNLIGWHISNEYGGYCYCENCEKEYRKWLKARYGTIEALNDAWNANFWGHTYYSFDEVVLPSMLSEEFEMNGEAKSTFQGNSLDYRRFTTDMTIALYRGEYDAIRGNSSAPITTNLMFNYGELDYARFAKYMDFIGWDSYPAWNGNIEDTAMWHDLMRGLARGESIALLEQTPSCQNWQPYCYQKKPGIMRLWSYQAIAHGADTCLYFQMKRSIGACEKYHGALIDHVGTANTRVFREMTALGEELERLGDTLLEARSPAEAAIVFDWDNWWATRLSSGPSVLINYLEEIQTWYHAFLRKHIPVDFITADEVAARTVGAAASDEDGRSSSAAEQGLPYKLVLAPMLYMNKPGFDETIREYVKKGGHFLTTYFSGYVNETDKVLPGGYPGKWQDFLKVWVEESDALPPERDNSFMYNGTAYPARILCDVMHAAAKEDGAAANRSDAAAGTGLDTVPDEQRDEDRKTDKVPCVMGTYEKDYYAGTPAIIRSGYGNGGTFYVGTRSDDAFYSRFIGDICDELRIRCTAEGPADVEITERVNEKGDFIFVLNHAQEERILPAPVDGTDLLTGTTIAAGRELRLSPAEVLIIQKRK